MLCGTALRDVECAFAPPGPGSRPKPTKQLSIEKNTLSVVPLARLHFGSTMDLE